MTLHLRGAIPALSVLALLQGCGDPRAPSASNFKTALSKHYATHCLFVTPSVGLTAFPVTVQDDADRSRYEALVAAGLLTQSSRTVEKPGPLGIGTTQVREDGYDLTGAGRSTFQHGAGATDTGFCAGHYTVDQVTSFSPPTTADGRTVSDVHAMLTPTMASWVSTPAVQSRYGDELAAIHPTSVQSTLVLGPQGWMVAGD